MAELVSIITPCYNGEKYLDRYFESILEQTYPDVELIFVNDGSTDDTENIALAYGEKLMARGYFFTYIFQENAGQSAAINQGLKVFSGKYLNWTDCDDYIPHDSIARRVEFLENNPEVGLVIGRSAVVNDRDYSRIGLICETGMDRTDIKSLMTDFLKGDISCTCCCATMVRSSMFRDAMPDPLKIATPREIGQNYQMFIPIMFKYPVRYIQDELAFYVMHSDSHSHVRKTFEQRMQIADVVKSVLEGISDTIKVSESDKSWFRLLINEYDSKNRLFVMQHYRRDDNIDSIVRKLKSLGKYDVNARKMVLKIKYPFIKQLSDRVWKLRNK